MTKSLVAAVALTIGLAGSAVAQEAVHRHHHHHRHHHTLQPWQSPELQPGPTPDANDASIYWSPAGGNPIHYAQTTGFYAGR